MPKFDLLLADPPWKQSRGGKKAVRPISSGENLPYSTLSTLEIGDYLKTARDLCEPNHLLFLWTIDKFLLESEQLVKDLGYKVHARMIWNKVTGIPAAFTIRYGHEYLLYCYHGKLLPVATDQRGKIHSVFTEKAKKHSEKPQKSYEIIESLYPNARKLELFARNRRSGWDVWGDEVNSTIILY